MDLPPVSSTTVTSSQTTTKKSPTTETTTTSTTTPTTSTTTPTTSTTTTTTSTTTTTTSTTTPTTTSCKLGCHSLYPTAHPPIMESMAQNDALVAMYGNGFWLGIIRYPAGNTVMSITGFVSSVDGSPVTYGQFTTGGRRYESYMERCELRLAGIRCMSK
ncbi:hypothetical protein WR25_12352 [Diploscapter pachys]|uniref:Uncharacterized protein n=1 Tax=Diploscapter pachys TaxID=2018661 RepID=A0A2A2LB62_9BILA|nr:hypothetical protein WR25_12352 [Diploscapter pachys]